MLIQKICFGPKYNSGTETYIIDGIVLSDNQYDLIIDELGFGCIDTDDWIARKWIKQADKFLNSFKATPEQCEQGQSLVKRGVNIRIFANVCVILKNKVRNLLSNLETALLQCS